MSFQITAIYASLSALIILYLAFQVTTFRRSMKAGLGDKGDRGFAVAIRAHANAVEYVPISLILLLIAESLLPWTLFLHGCGTLLVLSRLAHAWGFVSSGGGASPFRMFGILGNWLMIVLLVFANLYAVLAG